MKVNVNPQEHARRMQLGRMLFKQEPFRWLSASDWAAWQPDISNRRKPPERTGDEWRFRHEFVPHNQPYIRAVFKRHFGDMGDGGKRAASISAMDIARGGVTIYDKDGNPVSGEGIAASNNWAPMLARLVGILYPEFPVGYAREFAKDATPYLQLIKPSKGPFSDWLEGRPPGTTPPVKPPATTPWDLFA